MAVNGTFTYLASDALGSAEVGLDPAGNPVAAQLYAPYGSVRYSSGGAGPAGSRTRPVRSRSGWPEGPRSAPLWAVTVYSEDFDHASSANAFYGRALDRPAEYLLARWSNSSNFAAFAPNGSGGWTFSHEVTGVIAPQWDTTTGAVEVVVPIREVASSGSASSGSWAYLDVGFAYQDPASGTWFDNDYLQVHVRLTASGTAPI